MEAILEATARVFLREGYDRASTNRIAQAAGVSVGSLYQYFPNKEALAAALIDRQLTQMETQLSLPRDAAERPLEATVRALVRGMLAAHRVHPRLHRVLTEQVPALGRSDRARDIDACARELVRELLEHKRDEIREVDLDLATFVLVSSMEAVTHEAAQAHPSYLADPRLEDELVQLALRYLHSSV